MHVASWFHLSSLLLLHCFFHVSLGSVVLAQLDTLANSSDLTLARTKWESLQNDLGPLDYKYGIVNATTQTESSTPYIVLVVQDVVTEVEAAFWDGSDAGDTDLADYLTVNGMFDLLQSSIDAGSIVTASYDETYGYPLYFKITSNETGITSYVIDPMTIYSMAQSQLNTNIALWNQTSSVDYDYTVRISCFCIPSATTPKRIEVRGGEIQNITDLDSGMESENFFYGTIEAQFDEIQAAINDKLYVVDVTYNDTMGYPSSFYIDVHPGLADDEKATEVSDVVVMKTTPPVQAENNSPTNAPSAVATEESTDLGIESTIAPSRESNATVSSSPMSYSSIYRSTRRTIMITITILFSLLF